MAVTFFLVLLTTTSSPKPPNFVSTKFEMALEVAELEVRSLLGKYTYETPFDPGSVWSLIIALLPETVDPSEYIELVQHAPESNSNGIAIDPALGTFILQETQKLGWLQNNVTGSVKDAFTRVRVRQMDDTSGSLNWPLQTAWYSGVAYVLKLYRSYYGVHLSLRDFEAQGLDSLVEDILNHSSLSKLHRDVSFLILPLLSFHNRTDVIQNWVLRQPLRLVKVLAPIPLLGSTLLRLCYQVSAQDWLSVKEVQTHLKPQDANEAVSLATIYKPTESSIGFLGSLASAARILGTMCPPTFEVLAQWSFAPGDVQRGIYNSFLKQNTRWNNIVDDIAILRKTVFCNLTTEEIDNDLLIGALRSGKYMFLQKQNLESKEIIETEAASIVAAFKQEGPAGPEFSTVLAALEVVPKGSLTASKRQFAALNAAHTQFKVDPAVAVHMEPMAVIRRALELVPEAYPRVSDLSRIANELAGKSLNEEVKEACVNASLAQGDFSTAYDLCQTLLPSSSTWVPYLQVAKFMSPMWDTKPASVAERQKQLIIKCLETCPKSDLVTVVRVWETLEEETRNEPTLPRDVGVTQGPQRTRKRDQLQKLLIGGIGWAIGAPVE